MRIDAPPLPLRIRLQPLVLSFVQFFFNCSSSPFFAPPQHLSSTLSSLFIRKPSQTIWKPIKLTIDSSDSDDDDDDDDGDDGDAEDGKGGGGGRERNEGRKGGNDADGDADGGGNDDANDSSSSDEDDQAESDSSAGQEGEEFHVKQILGDKIDPKDGERVWHVLW